MTGTRLGLDWTPICNSVKLTVRQHTKSPYVKVAHYAEWVLDHPEKVCADLQGLPMKTMRIRLSAAWDEKMGWRRFSHGRNGPVYVVLGVRE